MYGPIHPADFNREPYILGIERLIELGDEQYGRGNYHLDHVVEIADGGHPVSPKNIQVLPIAAHRAKTAAHRRQRAASKYQPQWPPTERCYAMARESPEIEERLAALEEQNA